jgi:hypothetical protein
MSDHDWKKIAKIVLVLIVAYVLYTLLFKSSSPSSIAHATYVPTKTVGQREPFDSLNSLVDDDDHGYDLTEQVNGQYGLYGPLHTYELSFDDKASVSDSQLILEQVVTPITMPQAESNPAVSSGSIVPTLPSSVVASASSVVASASSAAASAASSVMARVNSGVGSSVDSVNTYINDNQQKISSGLSSLFDNVKSSLSNVNL